VAKKKSRELLIMVPTYNESMNIENLLRAVLSMGGSFDVLVVDDNSPDGTAKIAERLAKKNKRLKVIVRKGPKGRGLAAIRAYEYFYKSGYKYMVELDADFQEDPRDVFKLVDWAKKHNAFIAVGSRYVKGGGFESDKKWLSLLANFFILIMFNTKIKDLTCTFHAIDRKVFDLIPYNQLKSEGFFIASELHLLAEKSGLKVVDVPIFFPRREKGKTKISVGVAADFVKNAILMFFRRKNWKK
jgi:dolichol-phosphate mannosyltransferase